MSARRVHGLTLIELLAAIAIAAIMAGLAAPGFLEGIKRGHLEGTVNAFGIDLQNARSEALRRRTTATVAVASDGASYTLAYTPTSGSDVVLKTVSMPTGVTLSVVTIAFDGLRGTTSAQTVNVASSGISAQLRVTTNAVGRISTCSPSMSFRGYPTC